MSIALTFIFFRIRKVQDKMASTNSPNAHPVQAAGNTKLRAKHIFTRLTRWFFYCLSISLVQPIFHFFWSVTYDKPLQPFDLFAHGEVPLICLAVVSSSILDLLNTRKSLGTLGDFVLGVSCLISVISAIWFGLFGYGGIASNTSGFNTLTISVCVNG